MQAKKSIKQTFKSTPEILALMEAFKLMVNDCIRIGLESDVSSLKRLSLLAYRQLGRYGGFSGYRLCAISKATGILSARKKSIKRGHATKRPYLSKPILTSCYGLKIEHGQLRIPLDGDGHYAWIPLHPHTLRVISSDPSLRINSFTLREDSLSLCISKRVKEIQPSELAGTTGIDRNLRNLAVGNSMQVTYYDTSKIVGIAERTRCIVGSFKRNDARIRKELASKYGRRRRERVQHILHRISKDVVKNAKSRGQAIVFEDIRGIRGLYRKGSGQTRSYRSMMNSWPFHQLKSQIEYKAAWEGVPVITLSRSETRGTTMTCPRCGERLQWAFKGDEEHRRQLWCGRCERWMDRDLVAVLNISHRGWVRFAQSKGEAGEAVKGNPLAEVSSQEPVILRVDASKVTTKGH